MNFVKPYQMTTNHRKKTTGCKLFSFPGRSGTKQGAKLGKKYLFKSRRIDKFLAFSKRPFSITLIVRGLITP